MVLALNNIANLNLENQRVLIRQDLNVPIKNGVITSTKRIDAALPTIKKVLDQGASVILMSHLGRPVEGGDKKDNEAFSLAPVAAYIERALGQPVPLISDYLAGPVTVGKGDIVLCENIRFNNGEKANDDDLARAYARLCDIYVMDAFGTAHRAQASTHGVAKYAPIACAGPLMIAELTALESALNNPKKPVMAIVGGSKVSTKLTVLETLANSCDQIIVGGGIANTFLAAAGKPVGRSLYEPELIDKARAIMDRVDIPLPTDVVVGKALSETAVAELKSVDNVGDDDMIFDIGPQTSQHFDQMINAAKTIIWNGPVGVFEMEQFSSGTAKLARAIADSQAFSIAGGGDTLAAVEQFGIADKVSYISTGGGAFLEYVEGKELPAVAILKTRINKV